MTAIITSYMFSEQSHSEAFSGIVVNPEGGRQLKTTYLSNNLIPVSNPK